MEKIYLIEDINGLKYVGRTKLTLNMRLNKHKSNKKRGDCSSKKLELDNCTITCLDIADSKKEAHELEKFYINSIECVNHYKYNFDQKENKKEYREKNKDKIKEYDKKRYPIRRIKANLDKIKLFHYQKSWGGDKRSQNNLLQIDVNLFN